MTRTFEQWLDYLNTLNPKVIDLGLARISSLAERLHLTKFTCPVITVGGTNGKGSVVRFLECIYKEAGYEVAAYTSPHLIRFNERLRFNGIDVSDNHWLEAFAFIEKHRADLALTFFEFTTLAMLYLCQRRALDVLILEVGLGGRLDAVNIVAPDVAVITSIGLDHLEWLGPDRESIGREKAGIMRENRPIVCGDPEPPNALLQAASEKKAPYWQYQKHFGFKVVGTHWEWRGPEKTYLRLPLPKLKLQNAATSLMVVELLQNALPVTQFALIRGLAKASLPGRWEHISQPVSLILDVAHNPPATADLALRLAETPIKGRTLAVLGMLKDKDIVGAIKPLVSSIDCWYTASLPVHRGALSEDLMRALATQGVECCYNFASVAQALSEAIAQCGPNDRVIIFGSFYTVSFAKQFLSRGN